MVVDGHDEETRIGDDAPQHRAVEGIILARRTHLCTSWGLPQIVKIFEMKVKRMSNLIEVSRYERKNGTWTYSQYTNTQHITCNIVQYKYEFTMKEEGNKRHYTNKSCDAQKY